MPNILKNISLKPYNTFGLDTSARLFVEVKSLEELQEVVRSSKFKINDVLVLGGGSNILLTQDMDGLVVKNSIQGKEIVSENEEEIVIKVGAGTNWHEFVMNCVEKGYGGVENLSLIPGTVGAAPMQNIGAYGVEIKDVFVQLEALHRFSNKMEIFDNATCEFGYRESIFKHSHKDKYIIVNVTFRLSKKPKLNLDYGAIRDVLAEKEITEPTIKDVSNAVIEIRQSKLPDPKKIGNSGSFFKNPVISKEALLSIRKDYPEIPTYPIDDNSVKVPAGWLIEQAGWKGKTFGSIGVHKKQALVLVNYGAGKGADIKKLSEDIQASIFEKFGVALQAEVNII